MHVLTTHRKKNNKVYTSYFLAQSYWDKNIKRSRTKLIARLTGLPKDIILSIKQHLKSKGGPLVASDNLEASSGKDHGLVSAYWELGKASGLWSLVHRYTKRQSERVIAMILNRLADPKAKYSLRDWLATTTTCSILDKDPDHFHYNRCYEALDAVEKHHVQIEDDLQQCLGAKSRRLTLYDLTSSYFEGAGTNEELITYGYNRDKKKGKKQVVIGLITNENGLPLSVEVLPGNTPDSSVPTSVLKSRIERQNRIYNFH